VISLFQAFTKSPTWFSSDFWNSHYFYVEKTDVTNICLESHFWPIITNYWRFGGYFFKT